MRFFDRFRTALSRYEDGVHELGAPASGEALEEATRELGGPLPEALHDFLSQWNGAFLFHDDVALFGVEGAHPELSGLSRDGDVICIGRTLGGSLFLDDAGRVFVIDEEDGEARVEGTDFERWLDATMAREGLLYDREGEYREEAFDGEALAPKIARKRTQIGVKTDPDSPAWREEAAEAALELGHTDEAIVELRQAVALGDKAGSARLEAALAPLRLRVGRLLLDGDPIAAAESFTRAARGSGDPQEAAFAWAQAARASRAANLIEAAIEHAKRVGELAPSFVEEQRAAAAHLVEEGDLDDAIERLALALAVDPDDAALQSLSALTRARKALRQQS